MLPPDQLRTQNAFCAVPDIPLTEIKGKIDFAIISIREDEFEAVLHYFPSRWRVTSHKRRYSISKLDIPGGGNYLIAMLRTTEQGGGAAQAAARDLIEELNPKWLLVVGIAGGCPLHEVGLGDVVVSTRIHDFSVEAVLQDGTQEYNIGGGPLHHEAAALVADLPARRSEMLGWNSAENIKAQRPRVKLTEDRLEGPAEWKRKVNNSISSNARRNEPLAIAGAIASSDRLVRNPELLNVWLKTARHVCAVEMESAGIYHAAHQKLPFLAIRGISDVVGFKRDDPRWTRYACFTAAAFTRALLLTRPIDAPNRDLWIQDELEGRVAEIIFSSTECFVGRESESSQLAAFLKKPSGVCVITGNAGCGKSALLSNWINSLQGSRTFVARHFFSYRYEITRSVKHAYCGLLRQLWTYHDWFDQDLAVGTQNLREKLRRVLSEAPREGEQIVVVLDGLDEAEGPINPFLPPSLPLGVYVVVSGRSAREEQPPYLQLWLQSAERLHLEDLSRPAIFEFIQQVAEGELAQLKPESVDRIADVTQGFPLYLRYLTDEIIHASKTGADPLAVLERSPRGFGLYIKEQLRFLSHLGEQQLLTINRLFALLSVAVNPLPRTDVQALMGLATLQLEKLPWEALRWLSIEATENNEWSFSLSHPLLREEFRRALAPEAEKVLRELVQYCEQWKEYKNPEYALRHRARHLAEAGNIDDLLHLTRDEDYVRAQIDTFGSYDNSFRMVERALTVLLNVGETRAIDIFEVALRCVALAEESTFATSDAFASAEQRRWDKALERTAEIKDALDVYLALLSLAWLSADKNDLKAAEDIAARIVKLPPVNYVWGQWPSGPFRALVAGRLADIGASEPDRFFRLQGEKLENEITAVLTPFRFELGRRLAEVLGARGRAMLLNFALERARAIENLDTADFSISSGAGELGRFEIFGEIARLAAEFTDAVTATSILTRIIDWSNENGALHHEGERDFITADLLAEIVSACAQLEYSQETQLVLDSIVTYAARLTGAGCCSRVLAAVAKVYAKHEMTQIANELLDESFAGILPPKLNDGAGVLTSMLEQMYEGWRGSAKALEAVTPIAAMIEAHIALDSRQIEFDDNASLLIPQYWTTISEAYVALGESDVLKSTLQFAARLIDNSIESAFTFAVLSKSWVLLNQEDIGLAWLKKALDAAVDISDQPLRIKAFQLIVETCEQVAPDLGSVIQLLERLVKTSKALEPETDWLLLALQEDHPEKDPRVQLQVSIAFAFARLGNHAQAVIIVEQLDDPFLRATLYQQLGEETRAINELLSVLNSLENKTEFERRKSIGRVVRVCRLMTDPSCIRAVLDAALTLAGTISPNWGRSEVIVELAVTSISSAAERTLACLQSAFGRVSCFEQERQQRDLILMVITASSQITDRERLEALLNLCLKATTNLGPAWSFWPTVAVVRAWADHGQFRLDLLEQLLPPDKSFGSGTDRFHLVEICNVCKKWTDTKSAKKILRRVTKHSGSIYPLRDRRSMLQALAEAWLEIGEENRASQALGMAFRTLEEETAKGSMDRPMLTNNLRSLLDVCSQLSQISLAKPLLARAVRTANKVSYVQGRFEMFARVTLVWRNIGARLSTQEAANRSIMWHLRRTWTMWRARSYAAALVRSMLDATIYLSESDGLRAFPEIVGATDANDSVATAEILEAILARVETLDSTDDSQYSSDDDRLSIEIGKSYVLRTLVKTATNLDGICALPLALRCKAEAARIRSPSIRIEVETAIAIGLARLAQTEEAAAALEQAFQSGLLVVEEAIRAQCFAEIVPSIARSEIPLQQKEEFLLKVIDAAQAIKPLTSRGQLISALAKATVDFGSSKVAERVLKQALTIVPDTHSITPRAFALAGIATAWASLGNVEIAAELLKQSQSEAPKAAAEARFEALQAMAESTPAIKRDEDRNKCLREVILLMENTHLSERDLIYDSLGRGFANKGIEQQLVSQLHLVRRLEARRIVIASLAKNGKMSPSQLLELVLLEPFDRSCVEILLAQMLKLFAIQNDSERLRSLACLALHPQEKKVA